MDVHPPPPDGVASASSCAAPSASASSRSSPGLIVARRSGATVLPGEIADQSQRHGLLARIRDLGLDLQAVLLTDVPAHPSP